MRADDNTAATTGDPQHFGHFFLTIHVLIRQCSNSDCKCVNCYLIVRPFLLFLQTFFPVRANSHIPRHLQKGRPWLPPWAPLPVLHWPLLSQ